MGDPAPISAIIQICLRVRDARRSADFYRTVLGLEEVPGPSGNTLMCVSRNSCGRDACRLTLLEGLPPGDHLIGLDHFSLEVRSPHDVEAVYQKAESYGCRVTKPRLTDGRMQLFVFDPDGYKLAVASDNTHPGSGAQETTA
ncbi:MAG: VOC family protein, partial [Phycisphaerales bacterium]